MIKPCFMLILYSLSTPVIAVVNTAPAITGSGVPSPSANVLEVFASLAIVIVVIFLLAWFIKRMGHMNMSKNHALQIKASLPLSTKEKLLVVQVGDEQIVIGVAPGFVGHIKTLDTPLIKDDATSTITMSTDSFTHTMNRILKGSFTDNNNVNATPNNHRKNIPKEENRDA